MVQESSVCVQHCSLILALKLCMLYNEVTNSIALVSHLTNFETLQGAVHVDYEVFSGTVGTPCLLVDCGENKFSYSRGQTVGKREVGEARWYLQIT